MTVFPGLVDPKPNDIHNFPYSTIFAVSTWVLLIIAYIISKWHQKSKSIYVIPRVFVLCSPRTIQFQYEIILRIGLPSPDFNPDKHDIDITVMGQTNNEVVPMTRLNTKTLADEPLITNLSIVVYRLVEMPPLSSIILKHSGPYRSWIYAYDFTVIDLATNREEYYTLNQYISSINRTMQLTETPPNVPVNYPIDDVPIPSWTIEDIFLFMTTLSNCIMFFVIWMPITCSYEMDIAVVFITAAGGCCLAICLDWLLRFYVRWNQDRKEYFNEYKTARCCPNETCQRLMVICLTIITACILIYYTISIVDWKDSVIWYLASLNSCVIVIGIWLVCTQLELGPTLSTWGLSLQGVNSIEIGLKYSDLISTAQRSKSGSNSDDGNSSTITVTSRMNQGFGTRSSVKSFGFDATGKATRISATSHSSITGATPSNLGLVAKVPIVSTLSNKPGPRMQKGAQQHPSTQQDPHHQPNREASKSRSLSGSHNSNISHNSKDKSQSVRASKT